MISEYAQGQTFNVSLPFYSESLKLRNGISTVVSWTSKF